MYPKSDRSTSTSSFTSQEDLKFPELYTQEWACLDDWSQYRITKIKGSKSRLVSPGTSLRLNLEANGSVYTCLCL